MGNDQIVWKKTGDDQWTANTQTRNGTDYTAVIDKSGNTYTITTNPGAVATPYTNLRAAKNHFRKFLFDK